MVEIKLELYVKNNVIEFAEIEYDCIEGRGWIMFTGPHCITDGREVIVW
jgi:hypothetical protein